MAEEEIKVSETGEPLALPPGVRLIRIEGGIYRLIWDLGDGLGAAWYSISRTQLQQIYGNNYWDYITDELPSVDSFRARYGNYYWGSVAEIDKTADDPWQDMRSRIFAQFGHVPGFDDSEIRRLILQGWFEGWSGDEFVANYQGTQYYQSLTENQRSWAVLSKAEQNEQVRVTATRLVDSYRSWWGIDPPGGISNSSILSSAQAITSGAATFEEWEYNTKRGAERIADTPAARAVIEEKRAAGSREVTIENLTKFVQDQWRSWVGPAPMPNGFSEEWGNRIFMKEQSEADLETRLKAIAQGRWTVKPIDVPWQDWAAPTKGLMQSLLELSSLDDGDSLLNTLLTQGYQGQDAVTTIRKDPRFLRTSTLRNELNNAVVSLGRQFGYIA